MIGRFLLPGEMKLPLVHKGCVEHSNGHHYCFAVTALGEPVIVGAAMGRSIKIDWPELVTLAIAAGIDTPDAATAGIAADAIAKASGKAEGAAP